MHPKPPCTHTYDHISQQLDSLADTEQQQTLYANEADASLFTTDTATLCAFNIIPSDLETEFPNDVHNDSYKNTSIHFYSKHKYRDTFGDAHLCAKIDYMYYCEYAHLLKKCTEHTCMSAIYYDQSSDIKADKCKTIVMFDTLPECKILDASDILILSNLQKPWTIVCKDVDSTFDLEYSTYHVLNMSELCEYSLMAGNYLLSQATSNCGGTPQ